MSNPFDPDKVRAMTMRFIYEGVVEVQLAAQKHIRAYLSKPGTGRVYRVSQGRASGRNLRARGFHRASAAGQPPAVNTGRLRQSWAIGSLTKRVEIDASKTFGQGKTKTGQDLATISYEYTRDRMSFVYGSNLKYARALEYGTRRMRARPYVRPVLNALNKRALTIVKNAIARGFAGGGK